MKKGRDGGKNGGEKGEKKGKKREKTDENSGQYTIASSRPPERRPSKEPCDFQDLFRLFLYFLQNTYSKPSKHYGRHFWSLKYFTKAQGTLLDLHGHPNRPLNALEGWFSGNLGEKKTLQVPPAVRIGKLFYMDNVDNRTSWILHRLWSFPGDPNRSR